MDEQRTGAIGNKETLRGQGTGSTPSSSMPSSSKTSDGGQGGTLGQTIEQVKTMARNVGDQARSTASNVGEQVRSAASNAGEQARSAASTATDTAQDLAKRASEQASAASDTIYEQGNRAVEYLSRNVEENPLAALLIVGALGYMAAYLIHARSQNR